MSHVFDTGLAVPQRTLMQRGAIALLAPLLRSNGGYLADVKPIGIVVRSYTDEIGIEMLMKSLNRSPAIGVATGTRDFAITGIGGREAMGECELMLYFLAQHSRDMQRGRQESDAVAEANPQADPGLHVMMEHALELLLGQYPASLATSLPPTATIKQFKPQREEELVTSPEAVVWLQTYRLTLLTVHPRRGSGTEWRTAPQLLESIGWRVTTDPDEPNRPAAAVASTSIDADTDL